MIQQNVNIYQKSVNRILQVDPNSEQVNFLDSRFYTRNEKYYPSVTYILQYFPKNKFFENWLKDVGHNADIIAKKAADEGTLVHETIERYLNGEEISWVNSKGNARYSLEAWKMILKFVDFWTTHKPKLIKAEEHLFSDKYAYAGTADIICEINGEIWVLDIKTSNSLHTSYDLQLASYLQAWNECYEEKATRAGILWLKSKSRGEDKTGKKIKGKGWEINESKRSNEENLLLFLKVYDLFKTENPNPKPIFESFPLKVQLK